jgi:PhoPQ-activated pathogenicity-related protein
MLLPLLSGLILSSTPVELDDYLRRHDTSFQWSVERREGTRTEIRMVSQTWQGVPWRHSLILVTPRSWKSGDTGVLYITGGAPNAKDLMELTLVAEMAGVPAAMLFDIPNQPIFGMTEDDLIAHTFERYLDTGDKNWPLLFPMAKSAIRAMDVVEEATKDQARPVRRFVVTGASKRGWTTWLVAASGDKRIAGIAPMVIDNLNMAAQMRHQLESWGKYSEMIADYTRRNLQNELSSERGIRLAQMVDPYSYRARMTAPTLIVNGSNDRYWTVDALKHYWSGLRQPKWVLTVPNAGHSLGNGLQALETITAFARACAGEFRMPNMTSKIERRDPDTFVAQVVSAPGVTRLRVWRAMSESLDFRDSRWEAIAQTDLDDEDGPAPRSTSSVAFNLPRSRNSAVFVEVRYKIDDREFSLTTPVEVVRKR